MLLPESFETAKVTAMAGPPTSPGPCPLMLVRVTDVALIETPLPSSTGVPGLAAGSCSWPVAWLVVAEEPSGDVCEVFAEVVVSGVASAVGSAGSDEHPATIAKERARGWDDEQELERSFVTLRRRLHGLAHGLIPPNLWCPTRGPHNVEFYNGRRPPPLGGSGARARDTPIGGKKSRPVVGPQPCVELDVSKSRLPPNVVDTSAKSLQH